MFKIIIQGIGCAAIILVSSLLSVKLWSVSCTCACQPSDSCVVLGVSGIFLALAILIIGCSCAVFLFKNVLNETKTKEEI